MDTQPITGKLYYEITNCSSLPVDAGLKFEIEEIVQMLEEIGYKVYVHHGPAKVTYRTWQPDMEHTDEVKETPNWRCIVAVKPGERVPERVDECQHLHFITVWKDEMKKRFWSLMTGK